MPTRRTHNRPPAKRTTPKKPVRRWSQQVTAHSDAMTLEPGVFQKGPKAMAESIKRSADSSHRLKSTPFRSAMSMLTFYENRAGDNLSDSRKLAIHKAKDELRKLYGRSPAPSST